MPGLFSGTPQQAPSYTTSTTETPRWMQDAIYNQIQWAQAAANQPFQQYEMPRVAELSPLQQQAYQQVVAGQGAWQPGMQKAQTGTQAQTGLGTASGLSEAQRSYLQQPLVSQNLQSGQTLFGRAAGMDIAGAAQPYLAQAGQTATAGIGGYMSPYQQNVLDVIAKQGARNLSENILPGVSDAFIRAGQFGSSRMGDIGSRAIRDTQEAILSEQSRAAQQGYSQALGASQADLARQAQLASTAGQLTGQQMQQLASLGQAQTGAGQAQQQFGLGAAAQAQQAQAADYQRQLSALQQLAGMQQQAQAMGAADVAALETAGQSQQQQQQRQLDSAYQQFMEQQLYPRQQLDWLSTQIRGMAPITPQTTTQQGYTTQFSPSPLSQLASGIYAYRGLNALTGGG